MKHYKATIGHGKVSIAFVEAYRETATAFHFEKRTPVTEWRVQLDKHEIMPTPAAALETLRLEMSQRLRELKRQIAETEQSFQWIATARKEAGEPLGE